MTTPLTRRLELRRLGEVCRSSVFSSEDGAAEAHLCIEPSRDDTFERQLEEVVDQYHRALETLGLPRHTAVFRRVFLSDAANQLEQVLASPLGTAVPPAEAAAVSCVEQPPVCYRKLALLAYHISDVSPEDKRLGRMQNLGSNAHSLRVRRPQRVLDFAASMTSKCGGTESASAQTAELFTSYCDYLNSSGCSLLGNTVRTWVYVHDVDAHYQGMVDARRELFQRQGLTRDSHYIVSTGIEGRTGDPHSRITLDALSVHGLDPGQIHYIDRLDHLNRTDDYGVTFERAARLDHGDRSHLFLSGTASIDSEGRILHRGDVLGQLDRTLENIRALLEEGESGLEDLAQMIVYLRDGADAERVAAALDERFPSLPFTVVRAPVCRPGWLVEIEGLAILPRDDPHWPSF